MADKPGQTILLVDDEAIIAMGEARMLEKHGYNVITVFSGEQAIGTATKETGLDLILMDIDLGKGMDGTQAAEVILRNRDIPVLFLSSHTEPEIVDRTEKITSYGYVVKNSGETVLLASISMAFKLHAAHRELRNREEALGKSENKLSLIFENTPNAITITEMETGIVVEANKGIEWTGWTKDEVIGKSPKMLQSWIRPDEEEIIKTIIQSEGKLTNHRVDFYKKDGSIAHALMNSLFIEMDGRPYLLTISNDITRLIESEGELRRAKEELEGTNEELNATIEELEATNEELQTTNEELEESKNDLETLLVEHKRIQQILRESEYFLEKSQEIGKIGSFITEITSLNPTRIQWRTSKVLDDIIGIDTAYLKTRESWLDLIFDSRAVIENVKRQLIEKKGTFELEYRIRRHTDGEIRWIYSLGEPKFDDDGNIKSIIGTVQDITDRKLVEEALRRSEERFSDLVQLLPETVFEADKQGRITFVNQTALEQFGYTQKDIENGLNVLTIIAPQEHQRAIENIGKIMHGGHLGLNEYTAVKKDGTRFPVLIHSSIIIRNGRPEGIRGFLADITERKRAEEALLKADKRYHNIIESLPMGMHLYRLEPDGRLVFTGANPAADKILGVDNSIFIGKTIEEAFPALTATDVPRRYREVAATGSPWHTEQVDYDENSIRGAFEVHAFQIGDRRMAAAFTDITERKRAEDELLKNQQLLNTVYDNIGAYVFMKDTGYRYTYANRKVCELFGRELPDIIGKSDDAFFSSESVQEIMKSDTSVIENGETITREEKDLVGSAGERPRTYWTVKIPLRDADGMVYALCGISTEITKLKDAEEALRESEERWQFALEGAGDGVWDWNAQTDKVFFSHQWKAMLGYEDNEIGDTLKEWDSRVHPDDHDRVHAEIKRHFDGISPLYTSEHRLKCKNGTYKWILDRGKVISRTPEGKPLRVLGTHTDITYRKLAEELYKTFLHAALDGFVVFNAAGHILEANDAFSKMTGYNHDELLKMSIPDLEANSDPDAVDRRIKQILRTGSGRFETRQRRKDGRVIDVDISVKVLEYEGDRQFVIIRDITDQKRAGAVLENSLREKEALLRELQHRMKNSLAMISGIINLELERIRDKGLREVLDNIKGRIESLSSLYALLFRSETVREVELGMYIKSIAGLLSDSYGAGRNITIKQSYDALQVNTKNAAAWGLIVNELLTNSFKYAFPRGRSGCITINLKKTDSGITLVISDNGEGLPDDFDIGNPNGLGLMLVKTLTLQLKGSLMFERGQENVFLVRAPVSSEA